MNEPRALKVPPEPEWDRIMSTHRTAAKQADDPFLAVCRECVCVCVSVYVCLYAEWIKKLLINLIKSKSSVNTTHRARMAIRTAAAAADQHKAVMEQ